jgi:uncharacterized protein (TIRG00374 family)
MRWRHLTDPVAPLGHGPLFRAVAVGFMANNLFPLRIGEVVRAWYLARESGAHAAAIFATVVVERMLDALCVLGLACGALIALSASRGDSMLARGALALLPVAIAPAGLLLWLRADPERVVALVRAVLRPFPRRIGAGAEVLLRRFGEGLGALRGGSHLFWIALHSLAIWLVASALPILAGLWALGVEIGSPLETLLAAWTTLAALGVAVALPSAPGFFGPYHYAFRMALEGFGVAPETAVAVGTLVHAVFWLTLTGLGLAVLRLRRTGLGELGAATGGSGTPRRR